VTAKFSTRVNEILGVEYPIIMGTMGPQSDAEFVAAAANAGIFACLSSILSRTSGELREAIRKTKSLTDKPFGVNINLFPMVSPIPIEEYTEASIEEGVPVIETSGRNPEALAERIKKAGVTLVHKCIGVRHARTAERLGADIIEVVGYEAAGHPGRDPIGSMALIPQVADAVKVPVVAGGGIGDARGVVAALALGAEGVVMGTVFVATQECPIPLELKQKLVEAKETDTMLAFRTKSDPLRALNNPLTQRILEMEEQGASLEDLKALIEGREGRPAGAVEEADWSLLSVGQVVGRVHDIPTIKELVERIVWEVEAVQERLNRALGGKA